MDKKSHLLFFALAALLFFLSSHSIFARNSGDVYLNQLMTGIPGCGGNCSPYASGPGGTEAGATYQCQYTTNQCAGGYAAKFMTCKLTSSKGCDVGNPVCGTDQYCAFQYSSWAHAPNPVSCDIGAQTASAYHCIGCNQYFDSQGILQTGNRCNPRCSDPCGLTCPAQKCQMTGPTTYTCVAATKTAAGTGSSYSVAAGSSSGAKGSSCCPAGTTSCNGFCCNDRFEKCATKLTKKVACVPNDNCKAPNKQICPAKDKPACCDASARCGLTIVDAGWPWGLREVATCLSKDSCTETTPPGVYCDTGPDGAKVCCYSPYTKCIPKAGSSVKICVAQGNDCTSAGKFPCTGTGDNTDITICCNSATACFNDDRGFPRCNE